MPRFPRALVLVAALAVFSLSSPSAAQQSAAPSQAEHSLPLAQQSQAKAAPPISADTGRALKSNSVVLHELSPWSMFLSADILVKAVMVGLVLASLVTWTVFIAKSIELFFARRRLR